MQTFLPFPSRVKSARVLDDRRLGKQRVECLQILGALTDIHKSTIPLRSQEELLDLVPAGFVSDSPFAMRTPLGDLWVWNPRHRTNAWRNHPAVVMWRGYEPALVRYSLTMCQEWIRRGHVDTINHTISMLADLAYMVSLAYPEYSGWASLEQPWWWGDDRLHTSHQSNLYRKDPEYYARFAEVDETEYWWPGAGPGR